MVAHSRVEPTTEKDGIEVTLVEIDDAAFSFCEGLTEITFPESLVRIGPSAFSYCTKLKSVEFPASLKSIGGWAFSGCKKVKSFVFHGESMQNVKMSGPYWIFIG